MPNPFLRRQAATSKTDVDRPVAVEPIPERVAGHVFAYRGMETHGVDPNNDAHDPEDYGYMQRGVYVDYEPEETGPEPIPVIIVQRGGKERKRFRTVRSSAAGSGDNPSCILGRDEFRRKVTIRNAGTDQVFIGHEAAAAVAMHGYPLSANESISIEAWAAVYAQSATANVVPIAMLVEYVNDGNNE